ncbi:hypothetical protein AALB16_02715 [Lachnospiraceae bacterium 62-35]
MKKSILFPVAAISCACMVWGCKSKNNDNMDLSSSHTTAAAETMADSVTEASKETSAAKPSDPEESTASAARGAEISKYTNQKVSIEYPVIEESASSNAAAVNDLLKKNALSLIQAYGLDEAKDSLSVSCQVISVSNKRLTAVYKGELSASGAPHPTAVYFTNTVDLNKAIDIGLSSYADPYTMAGYVMSEDCQFKGLTPEQEQAVKEFKSAKSIDDYNQLFKGADFPLKGEGFPESFSYEKQGEIYLSIPVPHALGDYAVVVFTPDTK